jgi:hypothetical protein
MLAFLLIFSRDALNVELYPFIKLTSDKALITNNRTGSGGKS